jgi:hypothetical protein
MPNRITAVAAWKNLGMVSSMFPDSLAGYYVSQLNTEVLTGNCQWSAASSSLLLEFAPESSATNHHFEAVTNAAFLVRSTPHG